MKRINSFIYISLLLLFLVLVSCSDNVQDDALQKYDVLYVIDGDTFVVRTPLGTQKVRILGIDAPEIKHEGKGFNECFGVEAKEFLQKLIQGKDVLLVKDELAGNYDKYGRLLRYVYVENNSQVVDVGSLLISLGYAEVFEKESFEKKNLYLELEKKAKENKKGMWGGCVTTHP